MPTTSRTERLMLSCFATKNAKFTKAGGVVSHRVTEAQRGFKAGALPQTPKAIKSHAIDRIWDTGRSPISKSFLKLCEPVAKPLAQLLVEPRNTRKCERNRRIPFRVFRVFRGFAITSDLSESPYRACACAQPLYKENGKRKSWGLSPSTSRATATGGSRSRATARRSWAAFPAPRPLQGYSSRVATRLPPSHARR